MTTVKTLYKTTLATDGGEITMGEKKKPLAPYFVTGYLGDATGTAASALGWVGATLHVVSWVLALLFDVLCVGHISGGEASDKVAYDYWLTSFIPVVVGLVIVIGGWVFHLMSDGIKEGKFVPWGMTLITGGALVSLIFTYLLMSYPHITLHKAVELSADKIADGKTQAEADEAVADWATELRRFALWSLIFKTYIWQFAVSNQFYAASK